MWGGLQSPRLCCTGQQWCAPLALWRERRQLRQRHESSQAHQSGVPALRIDLNGPIDSCGGYWLGGQPTLAQKLRSAHERGHGNRSTQHGSARALIGCQPSQTSPGQLGRAELSACCFLIGLLACPGAPERAGAARGGAACSAGARAGFQPYQAALCLDSNGAPVDRFCPQPGAALDAVAAAAGARGDSDVAKDTAQVRAGSMLLQRKCALPVAWTHFVMAGLI